MRFALHVLSLLALSITCPEPVEGSKDSLSWLLSLPAREGASSLAHNLQRRWGNSNLFRPLAKGGLFF
jgi:hypothetical protein